MCGSGNTTTVTSNKNNKNNNGYKNSYDKIIRDVCVVAIATK